MNIDSAVAILIGIAGVWGGWVGGRRGAVAANAALAEGTITMLQARMTALESEANKIPALLDRIAFLESLVTQRADVETVKEIVTRIEEKLNGGS